MIEHEYNNVLNNFAHGWYLQDTSICDELIDYFIKTPRKVYGNVLSENGDTIVDNRVKESIETPLNYDIPVIKKYIDEHLSIVLNEYNNKFVFSTYTEPFGIVETGNIQYYPPGGGFKIWHAERTGCSSIASTRHLAFMTYLNDVTDAGETEFYYQRLKFRPEKGLTVIFPADWTYYHRGVPSPTQQKYITAGWINFIPSEIGKEKRYFRPFEDR